jgi:hypothetical protein
MVLLEWNFDAEMVVHKGMAITLTIDDFTMLYHIYEYGKRSTDPRAGSYSCTNNLHLFPIQHKPEPLRISSTGAIVLTSMPTPFPHVDKAVSKHQHDWLRLLAVLGDTHGVIVSLTLYRDAEHLNHLAVAPMHALSACTRTPDS